MRNEIRLIVILSLLLGLISVPGEGLAGKPYEVVEIREGDATVTRTYDAKGDLEETSTVTLEEGLEVTRVKNGEDQLTEITRTKREDIPKTTNVRTTTTTTRYVPGTRHIWQTVKKQETIGSITGWGKAAKQTRTRTVTYSKTRPRTKLSVVEERAKIKDTIHGDFPVYDGTRVTETATTRKTDTLDPETQQYIEGPVIQKAQKATEDTETSFLEPDAFDAEVDEALALGDDSSAFETDPTAFGAPAATVSYELPTVRLFLDGGFKAQKSPTHNANLGVLDVGSGEHRFMGLATSIYAGGFETGGQFGDIPIGDAGKLQFKLDFGFNHADDKYGRGVDPDDDVTNGITYWDYAENGSPGISSEGSGAWGDTRIDFDDIKFDITAKYGAPCGLGSDEDGRPGLPGFETPRFYLEFGPSFNYSGLNADQRFELTSPSIDFAEFDVSSTTDLEFRDYSYGALIGAYYTLPIPTADNFAFSFGGNVFLGYYETHTDATQHNRCRVTFMGDPDVNVCPTALQDFELDFDLDDSGFEYGLSGMARVDYRIRNFFDGQLSVGAGYEIDWAGMSRLDAPTNLDLEGPVRVKWEHTLSHQFLVKLSYAF